MCADLTRSASERATSARARGWTIPRRAALVAAVVPLICALLVGGVTLLRLVENERQLEAGLARVASTWLADRLALAGKDQRDALLANAAARLGAHAGLFDADGAPLGETSLARLPAVDLRRVLAGEQAEIAIDGRPHQVAAATLRPPLGRINAVVALPVRELDVGGSLLAPLARLGVVALLMLLAAAVFGACYSVGLSSTARGLARWIEYAFRGLGPPPGRPLPLDDTELGDVARAAERLGQRIENQSSAYRDARQEVEAIDSEEDDLLTAVSRELRAPLNDVVALSERLLAGEDGALESSQQEDVRIIRQASQRLLKMVGEVVDLSALATGEIEFDSEPVDLVDVAREVVEIARGQVGKKQLAVTLERDGADAAVLVRGNRQRLWQVVTNLVSNAIKFTDRGAVTVRVGRADDGRARLEVEDTGVGIDPREQATVFDTFRQLGGRTRSMRGTGLGLAISRRLVELHGGKISVSSTPGSGTRFTIKLPEER